MLKFLRRDPTAWVAFAEAGLVLLMSLHLFGVDSDRVPLIMAVVTAALGVVSGVLTKRTSLAVAIGLMSVLKCTSSRDNRKPEPRHITPAPTARAAAPRISTNRQRTNLGRGSITL